MFAGAEAARYGKLIIYIVWSNYPQSAFRWRESSAALSPLKGRELLLFILDKRLLLEPGRARACSDIANAAMFSPSYRSMSKVFELSNVKKLFQQDDFSVACSDSL